MDNRSGSTAGLGSSSSAPPSDRSAITKIVGGAMTGMSTPTSTKPAIPASSAPRVPERRVAVA